MAEPIILKGAHLYMLSSDESYIDESFEQPGSDPNNSMAAKALLRAEVPVCFFASLQHIVADKVIKDIGKLNQGNALVA